MQNLNDGEHILWFHQFTKGFFKKEVIAQWLITNQRALLIKKDAPLIAVSLLDSDIVVMNVRRISRGDRIGTFMSTGGAGSFYGISRGTSTVYGDLVFFAKGVEVLRFVAINDPEDVKRMVEIVKRETRR